MQSSMRIKQSPKIDPSDSLLDRFINQELIALLEEVN